MPVPSIKKAQFRGFALSHISNEVKAGVKKNLLTPKTTCDWIFKMAESGYKFSLQWDERSEAYQAALFCSDPQNDNAGLMLNIRHVDPLTAITALKTIHHDVYNEIWMVQADSSW